MDKKLRRILPIIITCITVILIIVASVLIIKTITDGKNKDDSPRRPGIASVDDSVLAGIEPFEDTYDKIIRDCYSRPGSEWKEGLYTFAYVDDNEIPDLIYMVHSEGKDIGYLYMNAEDNAEMKYLSNVWFGENGYMVEAEESTGENNSKLITYNEYKYVNGEKVPLNTLQYSYTDGEEIRTSTTDGKTVVIDTQEEFLRLINELVSKYRKITAGYSVDEYVNSDKPITEHISGSAPVDFEYVTQPPLIEEGNVTEQHGNYVWVTSTVLNSYASIEYFSEDTCVFKMPENGLYGLIDTRGNVLMPPEYQGFNQCTYGSGDIHYVILSENGNMYELNMDDFSIDPDAHGHGAGNKEIPAGFQDIDRYHNGLAAAKKDGKWGYVDTNLNTVIHFEYSEVTNDPIIDNCRAFDGTYIPVKKGGKMGIIDKNNQIIVPFEFTVIMNSKGGVFIAQKDGKWGFIGIGVQPEEPVRATVGTPDTSTNTDTVQDWERSYLNVINNPTFERFNFIITDIDNNGTPDMVLVAHSGINGPWTAICMNGQETDEFCDEAGYFDYLYVNGNQLATSSFMNFYSTDSNGQEIRQSSESYGYAQYENGLIIAPITYHKVTVYRENTIVSQEYYMYDKNNNFEMFPITEAEFNAVYNDIQRNYTEAEEVYGVDFRASGSNDLEGYIQVF